jgi:hypothetical protein
MFDEPTLLRAADAYERATEWHTRQPDIAVGSRHSAGQIEGR